MTSGDRAATAFFQWLVGKPRFVVALGLILAFSAASFLPQLVKDVRPDAFLAPDNPALLYRDKVKDLFGLSDPLVILVAADGKDGIFTPAILQFVKELTEELSSLENINSARLVSLATQSNITSSGQDLKISPFLDTLPDSRKGARAVRGQLENFPVYMGSLVSQDGRATLVIAEMENEDLAEGSYQDILTLLERVSIPGGVAVHLAGEGAVSGYLGRYIDADAQRLIPFAALVITLIIFFAYRSASSALMCNFVMASTVVITLGVMAGQGVAFYIVTGALPVILIGISVADAVHIYSHYFDLQEQQPGRVCKDLVLETMFAMWRPVSLTSLTTIAGFLGLYFTASMPPFKYFGLFAAFGVAIAWLYSLAVLPAAMVLTKPRRRQHMLGGRNGFMSAMGRITQKYSAAIILVFISISVLGVYSAMQLQVDDDPIGIFHSTEPIAVADRAINEYTNGSNTLDIVVETLMPEELFDPVKLKKIEALQAYIVGFPHVGGSVSIVDYLKQMNRSLNEGRAEFYRLPDTRELVAQYFLIYGAMSDPTDFEEEVDYDYQTANIRVHLNSGGYQDTRHVIEALERYIRVHFNNDEITATLSGRVNLNYHWIKELAGSHFSSILMALVLVWSVSAALFRSEIAGLYTLVPVAGAVLGVYAVMVLAGIDLGMGTSMFAAISIGLGIDFAIHTLDRMRVLIARDHRDIAAAYAEFYPTTGRALLFNFLAIACGFGVLLASKVVSLISFGGIVMLSIGISFIASMTLLPALIWRLRPAFLFTIGDSKAPLVLLRILVFSVLAIGLVFVAVPASASEEGQWSADDIVRRVNELDQGEYVTRNLAMTMTDRRGKSRLRETISYRKYFSGEKKTVLFYLAPANVRGTAFLTWDYMAPNVEDDQWLYLPALRKVRRISSGDRGDYFLGTDFTYDDMKQDGKLSVADFHYSITGGRSTKTPKPGDFEQISLESLPKTDKIAKELGYSRTLITIDTSNWVVRVVEFWGLKGRHLKTLTALDVREVQGIWTRHELTMKNHQTGHKTTLMLSNVDYTTPVKTNLFTRQALSRGY